MDVSDILWPMDFNGVAMNGAPTWGYENQEGTISINANKYEPADGKADVGMAWSQVVSLGKKNLPIWKITNRICFLILKTILVNLSVWSYMGKHW